MRSTAPLLPTTISPNMPEAYAWFPPVPRREARCTMNNPGSLLRFIRRIALRGDADATDGQLLERFALGRDEAAFSALVGRHGPMVLGVCRRLLPNAHDAE